jgi:PAS domain S-box-containing protein
MSVQFLKKLRTINPWHFLWITILLAEALTLILNSLQSLMRWGYISRDLIEIGTIDALIVSLIVASVIIYHLKAANEKLKQDISKCKTNEESLRKSEEYFRSMAEVSESVIYRLSPAGEVCYASPAVSRQFGFELGDVIGRHFLDFVTPQHHARALEALGVLLSGQPVSDIDLELLRADGASFPARIDVAPILRDGKVYELQGIIIDMTRQKKTEKELVESEEKFRLIAETITEVFWIADVLIERMLYISPCYERIWKRNCKSLYENPRSFIDAIHPDDRERVFADLEVQKTGQPFDHEYRIIQPDGTIRWIWDRGFPICNETGRVTRYAGIAQDITESNRAREALRKATIDIERELHFTEALMKSIPMPVFFKEADGRYLGCNKALSELLGVSLEDFIGKTVFELWPLEQAEVFHQQDLKLLENPAHQQYEYRISDVKGKPIDVIINKDVYMDESGRVRGIVGTFLDISDHKKAEEEVRRLSAERKVILDNIANGVFFLKNRVVKWANRRAVMMFGYSLEEMVGKDTSIFYPDRESFQQLGHEAYPLLVRGRTYSTERQMKKKGGGIIWCSIIGQAVKPDDLDEGTIWLMDDITERRLAEEELDKHRKQLEVLVEQRTAEVIEGRHLASLGELAAGVAHEINNPINGIINYGQLLVQKLADNSMEKDIADRIMKEGNRIALIVRSLLSFGGKRRDEKKNIHLNEIIAETLTLTASQMRKDGIHLEMNISENLPLVVANPQQLQQVFINVASNARYALNMKYPDLHSDKILEIKCEGVTIENVHYVRISFLDHGTGIPSDIIDKVIDPFFSTKPSGHGTGLGLSISHSIIKDHGGRLELESKEGEYTRVIIDLPVKI